MNAVLLLSGVLILFGCLFFFAGTVGLLRFPGTRSRLHALVKADNLGLGFVAFGLALQDGTVSGVIRLLAVWLLALTASTISAFLIAQWASVRKRDAAGDSGRPQQSP